MGAWGYGPFDSDEAMDWINNHVEPLLIAQIDSKLTSCVRSGFESDLDKFHAEAAIALLIQLSNPLEPIPDGLPINLYFQATEINLYHKATAVLSMILKDSAWLEGWSGENQEKRNQLEKAIMRLQDLENSTVS